MSDIDHTVTREATSTVKAVAAPVATTLQEMIPHLIQPTSVQVEVTSPASTPPSSFQNDVAMAKQMIADGKEPAAVQEYIQSHSLACGRSENKELYANTVLQQVNMANIKEFAQENGIKPALEASKALNKSPEISL
jgi:hypothetical protein